MFYPQTISCKKNNTSRFFDANALLRLQPEGQLKAISLQGEGFLDNQNERIVI